MASEAKPPPFEPPRQWVGRLPTAADAAAPRLETHQLPGGQLVRLVSYNILAAGPWFADSHTYCDVAFRSEEYRYPRVVEELRAYAAQIICLQEVQLPALEIFQKEFPEPRWTHIFNSHGRRKPHNKADAYRNAGGDLTLVDSTLFDVKEKCVFAFASQLRALYEPSRRNDLATAAVVAALGSVANRELKDELLHRHDGATLVVLKHKASKARVCVGNLHLWYNPRMPHCKALQAWLLVHGLRDFLKRKNLLVRPAPADGASADHPTAGALSDDDSQGAAASPSHPPGQADPLSSEPAAVAASGVGADGADTIDAAAAADAGPASPRQVTVRSFFSAPDAAAVPILLAGDYNSFAVQRRPLPEFDLDCVPDMPTGVYVLLTTGKLPVTHQDHPARRHHPDVPALSLPLTPFHNVHVTLRGSPPDVTTAVPWFRGGIDHIYASWYPSNHCSSRPKAAAAAAAPTTAEDGESPALPHIQRLLQMPYAPADSPDNSEATLAAADAFGPIPNEVWPSDHLAIGCEFLLG